MTKPREDNHSTVMLERSEASLNTEQRSFVTLRMTGTRENNHSTVMLERSEASKMVVLVITIVKEILRVAQDDKLDEDDKIAKDNHCICHAGAQRSI